MFKEDHLSFRQRKYMKVKNIIGRALGGIGLVVLSPVYLAIIVAIKKEDGITAPVFFSQKRVGIHKEYFNLYKFRSMRTDTPHDKPTHLLENPDQYITKVGRFLRKSSLDELPQLWNIARGDMAVIGPRPALWNQDDLIAERDKYGANDVKPGLTGWAQINGRDELEIPVKARLDGEYVKKMGPLMDIRCFIGTVFSVLRSDGVVEGGTGAKKKLMVITNHSYMLWQFRRELIGKLMEDYDVIISTPFVGHEDDFKAMGCTMIETDVDRRGINPKTDMKLYLTYRRLLKEHHPDMVVTYSIKPNVYAGYACRQMRIPYCVNVQGLGTAFQKKGLREIVIRMYKIALKKAKTVYFENKGNARVFLQEQIIRREQMCLLKGAGVNLKYYTYQKYPEYTTQATFVVASRGDANAYSNLSSANTMAKTFEKILKSNIMEKKICEKLKVEELDADIHAKVLEGTNMLVLSVTADTPKDSIDIIRTVMDNYSSVSLYTVGSAVMDVLEEPKVPYTPDNPLDAGGQAKKGGLVAGALVIILLGLFSYMKNTIKQENEIEKKLDARSLGAISYEWKYKTIRDIFRRKKKAILVDDPVASFRFVESYKKLAAKVEYRMAKNEQKVLVVTSVSENEGKSTVAANLAITLAEQSKRVLLVDGDIRRPSQFLIFGMEPKEENELGEYLKGNRALADVMVPCTRKHMLFMGGKNCYSSSTEMLNSDSFYKLMTACRKFVDYVIIDTPPAGIIGDAQIFAHCADAVMIVSKQNYMLAEDINEVMDDFRDKEGKVLGVVLNGVRSFSGLVDSPVGHYYGKYSKYGRYGNYGRSKGM